MSNEMTLFGKPNNAALALLSGVEDSLTSTLAGGGSGNKRISIEGGAFREYVGGKEVRVSEERSMKVILINAAPVSRMFFEGTYVKGAKTKPTCWSSDTQTPDKAVPEDSDRQNFAKTASNTSRVPVKATPAHAVFNNVLPWHLMASCTKKPCTKSHCHQHLCLAMPRVRRCHCKPMAVTSRHTTPPRFLS